MKYLFGPVKSRRLGLSLGIDLMPKKTCSLNCAYCECGDTTNLTIDRAEYVPADAVISELTSYLDTQPVLDYVTFSGSGEPTLHSKIGDIIHFLKESYQYKVAVLTNSTLLWHTEVRGALMEADLVVPSLDTVTEAGFKSLLRAHPGLTPQLLIDGLRLFCDAYQGDLILEIFVAEGFNDSDEEIDAVIAVCKTLRYTAVQINTLDRPGADPRVRPLSVEALRRVYLRFREIGAEVIAAKQLHSSVEPRDIKKEIHSLISRRPATIADLAAVFSVGEGHIVTILGHLEKEHVLEKRDGERGLFYSIKN